MKICKYVVEVVWGSIYSFLTKCWIVNAVFGDDYKITGIQEMQAKNIEESKEHSQHKKLSYWNSSPFFNQEHNMGQKLGKNKIGRPLPCRRW